MIVNGPTSKFAITQAVPKLSWPWIRGWQQRPVRGPVQSSVSRKRASVCAYSRTSLQAVSVIESAQRRDRFRRGVKAIGLGGLLILSASWVGCGGGDSTESEVGRSEQESEGNPLTAPVDYLGAVNNAQKSSADKLALVGLQQAIQQFTLLEERRPRNLTEVVSSGYIARLPEAPRGQELSYDPQTGVVSLAPRSEAHSVER